MSDQPSFSAYSETFSKFVPGFEFLQGLVKNAGQTLPSIGQWVAPTLDPQELERRISELRTVQFWLEQNARMIGTTVQALEVQRMTLGTLKTMNVQMGDLGEALKMPSMPSMADVFASAAASPAPAPTPAPAPAPAPAEPPAAPAVDPMQWWGALTQQFTQLATQAMQATSEATTEAQARAAEALKATTEAAAEAQARASEAMAEAVKEAVTTAAETVVPVAKKAARQAAPKPAPETPPAATPASKKAACNRARPLPASPPRADRRQRRAGRTMHTFLTAHATHPDAHMALALVAAQIDAQRAALPEPAGEDGGAGASAEPFSLGFVYITDHYAPRADALLAELRQRWPWVSWVGGVGVGVAVSGVEYFDEPALVLMLADLPPGSFELYSGERPLVRSDVQAALVHGDGQIPDMGELITELAARTTSGYLFGGLMASRGRRVQFCAPAASTGSVALTGVYEGGVSGVAFTRDVALLSRVTQGCQPIGPVRHVDEARDHIVAVLDGRSALSCLLNDLDIDPRPPARGRAAACGRRWSD